jgi:hypothetical protein
MGLNRGPATGYWRTGRLGRDLVVSGIAADGGDSRSYGGSGHQYRNVSGGIIIPPRFFVDSPIEIWWMKLGLQLGARYGIQKYI